LRNVTDGLGKVVGKILFLAKSHEALEAVDPLARLLIVEGVCVYFILIKK